METGSLKNSKNIKNVNGGGFGDATQFHNQLMSCLEDKFVRINLFNMPRLPESLTTYLSNFFPNSQLTIKDQKIVLKYKMQSMSRKDQYLSFKEEIITKSTKN
jgi:hypothetical protein